MNINDFEVGTFVRDQYQELSVVKKCVHGNKYYAWVDGSALDDFSEDFELSSLPFADDTQENHIECCS